MLPWTMFQRILKARNGVIQVWSFVVWASYLLYFTIQNKPKSYFVEEIARTWESKPLMTKQHQTTIDWNGVCVRACVCVWGKKHIRGICYHHPPSRIPVTDVFCRESQYPHGPFIFRELNIGPPLWLVGKMTYISVPLFLKLQKRWRKETKESWQLSKDREKSL